MTVVVLKMGAAAKELVAVVAVKIEINSILINFEYKNIFGAQN